jgi:transglutaminase-like putative cysteine protease
MVKTKTVLTILTYIIGLLGGAAVFPYLDSIARIIIVTAFAVGIAADRKGRFHLQGLTPTILSICFFLYYFSNISADNLVVPVVNLVVILLSVRLTGDKTERNCMQIAVLSLFALAGSSLLNLDMTFLLYLLLYLICVASFLVFISFRASGPVQSLSGSELRKILVVSLAMPVISFPLLMAFFIILPRTQYPMWNFLNGYGRKVAGFSERVEPGGSDVRGDLKTVAFRATSPLLPDRDLYWRGIVLNSIKGNTWVRSELQIKEVPLAGKGIVVRQTIYPEPNANHFLIALDTPRVVIGVKSEKFPDYIFVRHRLRTGRFKYDTVSVITDILGIKSGIDREFYLRTPAGISPAVAGLARSISGRGETDADKVKNLEQYFVSRRFIYSNSNLPSRDHPMEDFLFKKKKGNCELFASSFALLLRLMGVPSRLVGGYYGGDYNNVGGYYIVTEDKAHVWVEAFIEGKGWLKIDPTVFSETTEQSGNKAGKNTLSELRLLTDSLGFYWNKTVINYDLEKQVHILMETNHAMKRIRLPSDSRKLLLILVPVPFCILILIFRKKYRYYSREDKIVRKFLKKVRKKYPAIEIGPSTGLRELAEMIDRPVVRSFADIYCNALYRDRKLSDSEYSELRRLVDNL